jgi:NAD(P)H-dependent FMN reductase
VQSAGALELQIIVGSTRPGRAGLPIATWFHDLAEELGTFRLRLVDLAQVNLPFLDEPHHPNLRKYTKEHTKAWSAQVDAADAYVFVTPEYNHGPPPALLNALDFVYHEWSYKPVSFVSYGGPAGGTRAVQMLKPITGAMRMVPIVEGVTIPFFRQHFAEGVFVPTEAHLKAAETMLAELLRWAEALRPMRARR